MQGGGGGGGGAHPTITNGGGGGSGSIINLTNQILPAAGSYRLVIGNPAGGGSNGNGDYYSNNLPAPTDGTNGSTASLVGPSLNYIASGGFGGHAYRHWTDPNTFTYNLSTGGSTNKTGTAHWSSITGWSPQTPVTGGPASGNGGVGATTFTPASSGGGGLIKITIRRK
jgi:hypothetical protein